MSAKFVVSHLDQQMGPFLEQELKAKWAKGELLPIDYVYDEAKKDWILLAERFEWAAVSSEASPPPLKPNAYKRKQPPAPPLQVQMPHSPIHPVAHNTGIINLAQIQTPIVASHVEPAGDMPTPAPQKAAAVAPAAPVAAAPVPPVTPPAIEITSQTLVKEWKKPNGHGAKVKIVDGMGELDLSPMNPGQVELVLQDSSAGLLKLQAPLCIQVKPLEPEEITWSLPVQQTVGQDLEVVFKAVDGKGAQCPHYADHFLLKVDGSEPREVQVAIAGGLATVKLANTKAESWKLTVHYHGTRALRLPEAKTLEWQPGPAARLILDGPPELVAGNPLKVQVKAVDQYGNLARTFQGTVILEVKAS